MLIVLNTRPPFLSGTIQFTRQKEMVSIVKDSTNDFAKLARLGSATLKAVTADVGAGEKGLTDRKNASESETRTDSGI